jgi:hypothetical protein
MAFNLTRAAATLTKTVALAIATTATIRRRLINIPARLATSARRLHLHLPTNWPWQQHWTALYQRALPARAHPT